MSSHKPIRILQVLTIMNRGGAEAMIMNYYRNMDRELVQFDFLLHREDEGAYDQEIRSLGGRIYRMPPIHPSNYRSYVNQLRDFFNDHKEYRVVHSHLNALSFIVLGQAKKQGVPVRISHSHLAVESGAIFKIFKKNTDKSAIVKDWIQHLIRRRVKKSATHYFACGQKAGEWLFGDPKKSKFQIINNAIDTKPFQYDQALSLQTKTLLQLNGKKVVGHIGRFNEQKNHIFLIEIFKALVLLDENYHLLLIGDGHLRSKLEGMVERYHLKDHVTFLGVREDIDQLIQAVDLCVFPSLYEGLPVTLIEAQAAGIKIFASDRITQEVNITGLVRFLSLETSPEEWARTINAETDYEKKDTRQKVIDGGYDIEVNAIALQNFYINHSKQ